MHSVESISINGLDGRKPAMSPRMKLIKRYANRRLYDTETSRTITLDDVAECVRLGRDVQVVDNLTGDDITSQVLGQTFLKISTEQNGGEFSTFLLTALIRGVLGNVSGFFSKLIEGGIGSGSLTPEKIEKIARSMVERGFLETVDLQGYVDKILFQLTEYRRRMDERVEEGIDLLKNEFSSLKETKIEELSDKIGEMARLIEEIQNR